MTAPSLSIVVPTFNRAPLLRFMLASIAQDFPTWPEDLQLVVVDNASTDDTREVVRSFVERGIPISLTCNPVNIGMDGNLAACFGLATGRYLWQIGDDEILYGGTASRVLSLCRSLDFGVLHLACDSFRHGLQEEVSRRRVPNVLDMRTMGRQEFFRRVNIFLTFISANVVNRQAVLERIPGFDSSAEKNSYLPQLSWIYGALRICDKHIHVRQPVFGALAGNTGGYRLVEVFGVNLRRITERHLSTTIPHAQRIMSNAALTRLIGSEIMAGRGPADANQFAGEDLAGAMRSCFGSRLYYWILIRPLVLSPVKIGNVFALLLRLFNRINRQSGYRFL